LRNLGTDFASPGTGSSSRTAPDPRCGHQQGANDAHRDDRRSRIPRGFRHPSIGSVVATTALMLVLACGSKGSSGSGAGGSSASGGHPRGAGGDSGSGSGTGGGVGGITGSGGGGSGGSGGMDPADAAPTDAESDASGSLRCGTMTCGPREACVHPPGPGTCLMPDGGQCPMGTSLLGGCCLPPLDPSCVAIDRPCTGPTATCACFSVNPCGSQLCVGASFQGRDVMCHGA
jgi:hypothetical protein